MQSTVTSKGQITLPKLIRDRLNLETGDRVEFLIQEDGSVYVLPVTSSIKELKGIGPKPKKAVTLEEMDKAILQGIRP